MEVEEEASGSIVPRWMLGVAMNMCGSVCINLGTNLMKLSHKLKEQEGGISSKGYLERNGVRRSHSAYAASLSTSSRLLGADQVFERPQRKSYSFSGRGVVEKQQYAEKMTGGNTVESKLELTILNAKRPGTKGVNLTDSLKRDDGNSNSSGSSSGSSSSTGMLHDLPKLNHGSNGHASIHQDAETVADSHNRGFADNNNIKNGSNYEYTYDHTNGNSGEIKGGTVYDSSNTNGHRSHSSSSSSINNNSNNANHFGMSVSSSNHLGSACGLSLLSSHTVWYTGAFSLVAGSLVNFVSMGFAAQSLLASLGSIQFVSNVIFGKAILREMVTRRIILGTLTIVGGNAITVIFSPGQEENFNSVELMSFYHDFDYQLLLFAELSLAVCLHFVYIHYKQHREDGAPLVASDTIMPLAYAICSAIIGTQSVIQAKCLSELISSSIQGQQQLFDPFTSMVLIVWLSTTVFWLVRMNRALAMFHGLFIIPALQVFWTFFSVLGGGMYFKEFQGLNSGEMAGFCIGVLVVFMGVSMLAPRTQVEHRRAPSIELTAVEVPPGADVEGDRESLLKEYAPDDSRSPLRRAFSADMEAGDEEIDWDHTRMVSLGFFPIITTDEDMHHLAHPFASDRLGVGYSLDAWNDDVDRDEDILSSVEHYHDMEARGFLEGILEEGGGGSSSSSSLLSSRIVNDAGPLQLQLPWRLKKQKTTPERGRAGPTAGEGGNPGAVGGYGSGGGGGANVSANGSGGCGGRPTSMLSPEEVQMIHKHAESLGEKRFKHGGEEVGGAPKRRGWFRRKPQ